MNRRQMLAILILASAHCLGIAAPPPDDFPNLDAHAFTGYYLRSYIGPGGHIYAAGPFTAVDGVARPGIARFDKYGVLDPTWAPTIADSSPQPALIAEDAQGNVAFSQYLTAFPDVTARLLYIPASTGAAVVLIDQTDVRKYIQALAFDDSGALYAAIGRQFIDAQPDLVAEVRKFAGGTTPDPSFSLLIDRPQQQSQIPFPVTINVMRAAGASLYLGGTMPSCAMRVSTATGTPDATWNPVPPGSGTGAAGLGIVPTIDDLVIGSDGWIYLGGTFAAQGARNLGRFGNDGTVDPTWLPAIDTPYPPVAVLALALDAAGGRLYLGGEFASIAGQAFNGLAAISTEIGAAPLQWRPDYVFGVDQVAGLGVLGDRVYMSTRFGKTRAFLQGSHDVFTSAALFAAQQYRDFLGREADAGGLAFWSSQITSGAMTRAQVIDTFFSSAEFQGTIAPVARLYFAYFLRIPEYDGINFWIGYSRAGHPLEEISDFFASSAEFGSTYGALDNGAFTTLVYSNVLGRAPDAGGFAFWKGLLDGGSSRGQVMLGFSESAEYRGTSDSMVYVTMMYIGMLRRSPDAGGFDFWVKYRNAGNPGLALIDGFLASQEYRDRYTVR